jgi:hypothetical protein
MTNTPINTATNTITSTLTNTATITNTPSYSKSGLGKDVLGPSPARSGEKIYLFTQKAPLQEHWDIYDVLGQRLAILDFTSGQSGFWDTQGVGRGLYFIKITLTYLDGTTQVEWQKATIR